MIRAGDSCVNLTLKNNPRMLDEVVVRPERMKYHASGFVADLSGSKISVGKQLSEVLAFLPGVSVSDGKVQILSKAPSAIYVDGLRVTSQRELEAIPAEMIQTVDVSYMAGADQSSDASGGVIRIVLKKSPKGGYSGYFYSGLNPVSHYGYGGEMASNYITLSRGRFALSNRLYFDRTKIYADEDNSYTYKDKDNTVASFDKTRGWRTTLYDRLNINVDIGNCHTLALSGMFSTTKIDNDISSLIGESLSVLNVDDCTDQYQIVGKYVWTNDDDGGKIDLTADYIHRYNRLGQNVSQKAELQSDLHSQSTDLLRTTASVLHRFGAVEFSGGLDMQYVKMSCKFSGNTDSFDKNGGVGFNGYRPAAFMQFSGSVKNIMYEAGLRFQGSLTRIEDHSIKVNKDIWEFCPAVSILCPFNADKGHLLMFNYRRSVDELPYSVISPYRTYTSELSYTTGNQNVTSPIENEVMALTTFFDKYTFIAGYNHISDPIYFATSSDASGQIKNEATNGTFESLLSFTAEALIDVTKWWSVKPKAMFGIHWADTPDYYVAAQSKWAFSINNSFNFSDSFGGGIYAKYEPDCNYMDMVMKSVYGVNGNIYKTFLKGNLQFRLDFNLYSKGRIVVTDTKSCRNIYRNLTKSPSLSFTATWYFRGGKKVKPKDDAESIQNYHVVDNNKDFD